MCLSMSFVCFGSMFFSRCFVLFLRVLMHECCVMFLVWFVLILDSIHCCQRCFSFWLVSGSLFYIQCFASLDFWSSTRSFDVVPRQNWNHEKGPEGEGGEWGETKTFPSHKSKPGFAYVLFQFGSFVFFLF